MPLAQQAGYYCNVCDCILRDSQSYLDHINGGGGPQAGGCSAGGGGGDGGMRLAGRPAAMGSRQGRSLLRGWRGGAGRACSAHTRHVNQVCTCPCPLAHPAAGKWHNRALGMSMRVEKSTAEQVGWGAAGGAGSPAAAEGDPRCCAAVEHGTSCWTRTWLWPASEGGQRRQPSFHPVAPCQPRCMAEATYLPLQVRARLDEAKKRKEGGDSSAADFAPDGEAPPCSPEPFNQSAPSRAACSRGAPSLPGDGSLWQLLSS